jgi:hypothetical protein
MKRLLPLIAILAILSSASAGAQESGSSGDATLTVEGQATVTRAPEVAIVAVGFTTNDGVATNAQSHNNSIYDAVLAALRGIGVNASAVKTTSYSMNYNPPPTPSPVTRETESMGRGPIRPDDGYGYVVNRQLSISTAPDQVGRVMDTSAGAGATEVNGITFGLRDRRSVWTQALSGAIADADHQARTLASGGRFRIVRLKSIQAGGQPYSPGPMMAMRMAAPATNIPPSDVDVSASVTVTYVIAP